MFGDDTYTPLARIILFVQVFSIVSVIVSSYFSAGGGVEVTCRSYLAGWDCEFGVAVIATGTAH